MMIKAQTVEMAVEWKLDADKYEDGCRYISESCWHRACGKLEYIARGRLEYIARALCRKARVLQCDAG